MILGVGEFSATVSTSKIVSTEKEKTFAFDAEFSLRLGLLADGMGGYVTAGGFYNRESTDIEGVDTEEFTTISYTLKDNDDGNFQSVTVVNPFDGYGPIFITEGGAASCPHEEEVNFSIL